MKNKVELDIEMSAKDQYYYLFGLVIFFVGLISFTYVALFGSRGSTASDIHSLMTAAQKANHEEIENNLKVEFERTSTLQLPERVKSWYHFVLHESSYTAQFSLVSFPFVFTVVQLSQSRSSGEFLTKLRHGDHLLSHFHEESLHEITSVLLNEARKKKIQTRALSQIEGARSAWIPLAWGEQMKDLLPSGSIVSLIHRNETHNLRYSSNDGLLFRDQGTLFLCHALPSGEIETVPWAPFLLRQPQDWIGFRVYQIKDSTSFKSLRKDSM